MCKIYYLDKDNVPKEKVINFEGLEAKPLERDNKINVQEKLDEVFSGFIKPEIKLNNGDRVNIFLEKVKDAVTEITSRVITSVIPTWFWVALIIVLSIIIIMSL